MLSYRPIRFCFCVLVPLAALVDGRPAKAGGNDTPPESAITRMHRVQNASIPEEGPAAKLEGQIREGKALFEQGKHTEAIHAYIRAMEKQPQDSWTTQQFELAVKGAVDAFLRLSPDERQEMISEYEDGGKRARQEKVPLEKSLTRWLREAIPATSLKSPAARMTLGAWHFIEGSKLRAVGYALGVLQQAPNSPATEYVITALVGMQYYSCDIGGAMRTLRVIARIAPNNRGAGWGVCRGALMFCCYGYVDRAVVLCEEIRSLAPNTVASRVATEMLRLIDEIEAMNYQAAFETVWGLREYAVPGPASHVLRTLTMGIDWGHLHEDRDSRARLGVLMHAAKAASETDPDPHRRTCALLIMAHCQQKQGKRKESAKLFQHVLAADQPGLEEYALAQMGCDLAHSDRKAAIAALERFRDKYDGSVGALHYLKLLANLYRESGRFAEGLELIQWIEDRCRQGYAVVEARGHRLTASKIGCLRGLGREAEAQQLAEPLLQRYGYGQPLETLAPTDLGALCSMLKEMGYTDENKRYFAEICRRSRLKREQGQKQ